MKLNNLLKDLKILYAPRHKNIDIQNIAHSTNNVCSNTLFVCLRGQNHNGHSFVKEAQKKGAVAFIVEEYDVNFSGLQILVQNAREALSKIAKAFYKPKKNLKVIGITGTNGKTTTTFMLANILKAAGKNVGIIGTEGVFFNDTKIWFNMTTPDPIELFKTLKQMSEQNVEYVVMEVSAHAIYLNKIDSIKFVAKGFTNITEDHLDFFETMQNYAKAKISFMQSGSCIKVVNNDDDYGEKMLISNKKIYSYSAEQESDVIAYDISKDASVYKINMFGKVIDINCLLVGNYNIENALCAATISYLLGISSKHIKQGICTFKSVEGRLNIYKNGNKMVIIDFAHTPDALQKVLKTIRPFCSGKLICIFGCGGNRDAQKRQHMGKIASELADEVIITNDNPRNEDPNQIAADIISGIKTNKYQIITNREDAIKQAVVSMSDGDIIALCGKGAENYMEINGKKYPYSDKEQVLKWGFNK